MNPSIPPISKSVSFSIYITRFVILIAGLLYAAVLLHVPAQWIAVGGIVLVGVGVLTGVKVTRQKDSPP
jgi:cadmium resistance protein CadD (predicted permease)